MTDLFDKRTDKEKLFDWIRARKWARTSDVIKWGTQNLSNRAERNARALATDGKLRRLDQDEKNRLLGYTDEEVWVTT